MIHLIDQTNRHLYRDELEQVHRERAHCFIDERGWPLQRTDKGEYDAYDDEAAAYLVAFGLDRAVTAACRIRSTEHGGLIPDHFPHLVSDAERPLESAGTFECTRYFCVPGLRGLAGMTTRSALHVAMVEHLNDIGGDRLVGFVDLPLLTHLRRFSGLRIRPIGLPATYDDAQTTIAFEIGVSSEDLVQTRLRLDQIRRQLFVAPPWLTVGTDTHAVASAITLLSSQEAADDIGEAIRAVAARHQSAPPPLSIGTAA